MNEGEFRGQFQAAVDTVLSGCESKNLMQVMGGFMEVYRLLSSFFDADWVSQAIDRAMAIQADDDLRAWWGQNIALAFEMFGMARS